MAVSMYRLVKNVVQVMGDIFPELKLHEMNIRDIIAAEETSFGRTLVKVIMMKFGMHILPTSLSLSSCYVNVSICLCLIPI